MTLPPDFTRKGPRRGNHWLLAVEYLLWPEPKPHGLLKALAYANNMTPRRLNSLASELRTRSKQT